MAFSSPPPQTFRDVVGLQLYSLREILGKDLDAGLQTARDLGIREVECSAMGMLPPQQIKQKLASYGLEPITWGIDYTALSSAERINQTIADAKAVGARYLVCYWINHAGKDLQPAEIRQAARLFEAAGKTCFESGLQFVYHIHGYEFQPYENGTLFDVLYQNTSSKYVNFELDTFWAYFGGQDPVAFLEKYGKRTPLMHLKDCKKGVEKDKTGQAPLEYDVPLGTGEIPVAEVLRKSRQIGQVKHYFIEDESAQVPGSIRQSLEFLQTINY